MNLNEPDYEIIYPEFWPVNSDFVPNDSTAFGYFDTDPVFVSEAPKTAEYIARQLGYDAVEIEITAKQIYTNIELATLKYSELVNNVRLRDRYIGLLGAPTSSVNTNTTPYFSLNFILRLSDAFATEAGAGGRINFYTGSIELREGVQLYNVRDEYFSQAHPDEASFTIRKVMYYRTTRTIYNKLYTDLGGAPTIASPYDGLWGSRVMLPMAEEVSRIQRGRMGREIYLANRSYHVVGENIRIFPIPRDSGQKLYFEYSLGSEEQLGRSGLDLDNVYAQQGMVNHFTDIDFQPIPWSGIHHQGRSWIIQYAYAMCKHTMGLNRRKFSSIPIPNSDISLDGDSLVSEGMASMESLVAELKETLSEFTIERGLEIQRNQIDHTLYIMSKNPILIRKF